MQNFHEHKLWQESFVALMDMHEALDSVEVEGREGDIVARVLDAGQKVSAKIADALSRTDRRMTRNLIFDSVGLVAVARTELAVAWGRGLLPDDTFKALDTKCADLSTSLQVYK
ncbi:hypothetical protein KKB64_01920 [Patescibacteria group bacterium]|nr:hypothetical protein [Patescibacteria group bacterium]MBU1472529.1 hypothetical protein [Patescibacteria group bacterium]MBU2460098.1 hypothetical protein [Patescibacteria group bacterium]MBU2544667.1 hypothetical protein [Patescibacteria group bacterium]